jgi:multidrug transporter EmrE-like cation transporter
VAPRNGISSVAGAHIGPTVLGHVSASPTFLLAVWNHRLGAALDPAAMMGLILVVVAVVLNVAAQVALKWAAMSLCPASAAGHTNVLGFADIMANPVRVAFNPWFLLGITLYGISVVNWLIVLGRMDLSVAYPLMSIGYILTLIIGALIFREPISAVRVSGIFVIMLGVYLITRPAPSLHG